MATLKLKKSVEDLGDLTGKKVFIRVDFNVPIGKKGEITNDYRIRSAVPTIKRVVDQKGIAILCSHLGRPEEKAVKYSDVKDAPASETAPGYSAEYSLKPVAARLSEILGGSIKVAFAADCMKAEDDIAALNAGDVILLENCRFYTDEGAKKEADRKDMAEKFASYADFYVSDAFGTAHRDSASMTGVPKALGKGVCGYLMEKEIKYFAAVLGAPQPPVVAIVGGAKVSDKIQLLENMLPRINKLLIGGAMAYTFLKAIGKEIGSSRCEDFIENKKTGEKKDVQQLARDLLAAAKSKNVEVFLPIDHICNNEFKAVDAPLVTEDDNIPAGYMGLDIGPKTLALYAEQINASKTAIWNGPMGVFEMDCYSKGTFGVAKAMGDATAAGGLLSIIGGGDSASAAELCGEAERMSHVSTGGGASLELLEGKTLPGIAVLEDK